MTDATDVLWSILIAAAPLVLVGIVAFVLGRWSQRKDRREEEDKARIYEPPYAQVLKLVTSEDSAKRGFSLNTPDILVLEGIVSHGLLVPPRHRALKQHVEKFKALTLTYNNRRFEFNIASGKAFAIEGEKRHSDPLKSDSALSNAVVGLSQEAFVKRYEEILHGTHKSRQDESTDASEMFRAITAVTAGARDLLREATDEILLHGKMMNAGLESALSRGKYRSAIERR